MAMSEAERQRLHRARVKAAQSPPRPVELPPLWKLVQQTARNALAQGDPEAMRRALELIADTMDDMAGMPGG
jgi:hypothetical protein